MILLSGLLMLASLAGAVYLVAAAAALRRFAALPAPRPAARPPVTILKPLCGEDAGLYENLRSFCEQAYPAVQVVFGVHTAADPAVPVVRRLMEDLPEADLALVIDGRLHGSNYKISNLINMIPAAKHDILVIADSDMRVQPGYLDAVVAPLLDPAAGLVTCLYRDRPEPDLWSRLHAMSVNYGFLPSVLVGQVLGAREGCFGATMALGRATLERIGGFAALRNRLADDYDLGEAVRGLGLKVVLSTYLVDNRVHEPGLAALFRHELRWARTMRSIAPAGFAASVVTYPLVPALLALAAAGPTLPALLTLGVVLACRFGFIAVADGALGLERPAPWLVPLRDLLSVAVLIASFCGTRVAWRQQQFRVELDGRLSIDGEPPS